MKLCTDEEITIIALCEAPPDFSFQSNCGFHLVEHIDDRHSHGDIQVIVRNEITTRYYYKEDSKFCLLRIEPVGINLMVLHLSSRLPPNSSEMQNADIGRALSAISRIEEKYGDKRTIIVGDFNMNPFDEKMMEFCGFNAKLFKNQIKQAARTIGGEKKDVYYNPMMLVYHDAKSSEEPRGTYFYDQVPPQWHCFDQALIKQHIVAAFDQDSLRILGKIGDEALMSNNKPNKKISDHLPIQFKLFFEGGPKHV